MLLNLGSKTSTKKRNFYCDEARAFVQVHYVREKGSGKYAFNVLTIKEDPDRERCAEWYHNHGDPENFQEIVSLYLKERKLNQDTICKKYGLSSDIFRIRGEQTSPLNKWEAVSICLGLKLNLSETRALLKKAGFALTNSFESDLVIRYCIVNKLYNLSDINYILDKLYSITLDNI